MGIGHLLGPVHILLMSGALILPLGVLALLVWGLIAIGTNRALRAEIRHLREENERLRSQPSGTD